MPASSIKFDAIGQAVYIVMDRLYRFALDTKTWSMGTGAIPSSSTIGFRGTKIAVFGMHDGETKNELDIESFRNL